MYGYRTYQILAGIVILIGLSIYSSFSGEALSGKLNNITDTINAVIEVYIAFLALSKVLRSHPMKHEQGKSDV